MESNKLISVCMIVYNHENSIREAIEGVLMQECNYRIELILTDDCSTDNTEAVVNSFNSHPKRDIIKYIRHPKNVGLFKNLMSNLENCSGDYIAFCEGDDYWIDPLKLEKQVKFLESNEDVVLTFTSRIVLEADATQYKSVYSERYWNKNDIYSNGAVFPLQTLVGRNYKSELIHFLSRFSHSYGFDKLIGYFYCLNGKVKSLEDITAVYRHNGQGIWSCYSRAEKAKLHIEESLKFYDTVVRENIDQVNVKELKHQLFKRIIDNNSTDNEFLRLFSQEYKLSYRLKLKVLTRLLRNKIKAIA